MLITIIRRRIIMITLFLNCPEYAAVDVTAMEMSWSFQRLSSLVYCGARYCTVVRGPLYLVQ